MRVTNYTISGNRQPWDFISHTETVDVWEVIEWRGPDVDNCTIIAVTLDKVTADLLITALEKKNLPKGQISMISGQMEIDS